MKSNLRSWAVVAVFAMMVTGCSIYHPQSVDIPMINHAGDTRVDANVALSTWVLPDVLTAGATVSYGFNDWLAGQAHLNFGGDNVYGQVAPGAYLPLGEHGLLEGYVGMGMGGRLAFAHGLVVGHVDLQLRLQRPLLHSLRAGEYRMARPVCNRRRLFVG
jgi:hypothetical protein